MVLDCLLMSKSSSEQKKYGFLYSIKLFFPYNRWEGLAYLSWFVNQLVVISIILCTAFIQKEKKIFCVAFVRKKLWHFWNRRENITSVLYNGSINAMFVVNKSLDRVNYNTSWIKKIYDKFYRLMGWTALFWELIRSRIYPWSRNPESRIQNPKSKIQNPESKIQNSKIPEFQNPAYSDHLVAVIYT